MAHYYGNATVNDDTYNPHAPDLGIDWHYSHGFGVGQVTFPNRLANGSYGPTHCPGRPATEYSTMVGGRCFTVQELLTEEGGTAAMMAKLTQAWQRAQRDHGSAGAEMLARWTFALYGVPNSCDPHVSHNCTNASIYRDSLNPRVAFYMHCSGGTATTTGAHGSTTSGHGTTTRPARGSTTSGHGSASRPTSSRPSSHSRPASTRPAHGSSSEHDAQGK
jgi:hypothetical protein